MIRISPPVDPVDVDPGHGRESTAGTRKVRNSALMAALDEADAWRIRTVSP